MGSIIHPERCRYPRIDLHPRTDHVRTFRDLDLLVDAGVPGRAADSQGIGPTVWIPGYGCRGSRGSRPSLQIAGFEAVVGYAPVKGWIHGGIGRYLTWRPASGDALMLTLLAV